MRERAEDMASFIVNLNMSPSDYWKLTLLEREAIIDVANKQR
jgi:hypothetical protein